MSHILAAFSLSAALAFATVCWADESDSLEPLDWLSGAWGAEIDGHWSEEHWISPRGGMMLGVGRRGIGSTARGFEYLRIQADNDGVITYWAMPGGQTEVPFRLTELGDQYAVFENPDHDFPSRIEYRLNGDSLEASISGPGDSRTISWSWNRI